MKKASITDFTSHAIQIIENVFETHEDLVITKRGKAIAKIIFYKEESSKSEPKRLSKYFISEADIISPASSTDWKA